MVQIDDQPLVRQHYGLRIISLFCRFVIEASVSLAAASSVLGIVFPDRDRHGEIPRPTTGGTWLLRLGLFKLQCPKTIADDWVWLVDHVVELGTCKCLMITGVRLSQLPVAGSCLELRDLEPIAALPVDQSNREIVHQQLEAQPEKTGVPRAILSDAGSDLLGGERQSCQSHPETTLLSDIAHYAARLLKRRMESDDRWKELCRQAAQAKCGTGRTELAFLTPPNQRSKARFMNLGPLLSWAEKMLVILDQQPTDVLGPITPERLNEKFGWLRAFRCKLVEWSQWQTLSERAIEVVRSEGYSAETSTILESHLRPLVRGESGDRLRLELASFVTEQSSRAKEGERLPGSTEILESSFGKLKSLRGDHQKGGFTHLLLCHAASLGETTNTLIGQALEQVPIKRVWHWCRENLGATLQSQRTTAHRAVAHYQAQENPGEPLSPEFLSTRTFQVARVRGGAPLFHPRIFWESRNFPLALGLGAFRL